MISQPPKIENDCDFFGVCHKNSENNQKPPIDWLKYLLLGGGILIMLGGVFFIKKSFSKAKSEPIMVYPVDQPLKIKPDINISHEHETAERPKSKPQNAIYDKIKPKKKKVIESDTVKEKPSMETERQPAMVPSSCSYYVCLGTFDSHYEASLKWQQIKGDYFDDLRDVEPIIRVVASDSGKGYQLLAGPLNKKKGLRIANEFKTSLLSVDN